MALLTEVLRVVLLAGVLEDALLCLEGRPGLGLGPEQELEPKVRPRVGLIAMAVLISRPELVGDREARSSSTAGSRGGGSR